MPIYPKPDQSLSLKDKIPRLTASLVANTVQVETWCMPKSYYDTGYWDYLLANDKTYQDYDSKNNDGTCNTNTSNSATVERIITHNGLDIYDGGVWMIANAIAGNKNLVKGYMKLLTNGGNTNFASYKAFTNNTAQVWGYGPTNSKADDYNSSYTMKLITSSWAFNIDPINSGLTGCRMNWPDYQAVTGEHAWSAIIGPVQAVYTLFGGNASTDSHWAQYVDSGLFLNYAASAVKSISLMQAPSGGIYRNVTIPGKAFDQSISTENCWSVYAGLSLLKQALSSDKEKTLVYSSQKENNKIDDTLDLIDEVLNKLVTYFTGKGGVEVFDTTNGIFYQGVSGTTPSTQGFAVDVQTWGIGVILSNPELETALNAAYGPNLVDSMWAYTKAKAGYYEDGKLLGVGYTTQASTDDWYTLSGEWTLGAINAVIKLVQRGGDKAASYVADGASMLGGIKDKIEIMTNSDELGMLYASDRVYIPFGWYSNAMPATASTAWGVMTYSCYNPFELGGGLNINTKTDACKQIGIVL